METKELNIAALVAELDEEFASGEEVEEEVSLEEQDDEDYIEEDVEEENEEPDTEDEDTEEDTEEELDEETHKRNQAFQKLREERDNLAKTDNFLSELAQAYGMTKDQLISRWQNEMDAKAAKKSGMSPQQFKQQQEVNERIAQLEREKEQEVFNLKTQSFVEKHKLKDADVQKVFDAAKEMGIPITKNPDLLEFVYKALNYDNALEEGRQKQLETSKKRTKTSTGTTGTRGRKANTSEDEIWDSEIEAILKENHLIK